MNNVDKLFGKKLTDHSLPPSARVWENVEAQLSKKNKKVAWLPWAAAFLLGGLLLSILWMKTEEAQLPMAKDTPRPEVQPQTPEAANEAISQTGKPKKKAIQRKTVQPQTVDQPLEKKEEVTVEQIAEIQTTPVSEAVAAIEKPKGIVLTYTLDAVETPANQHATEDVAVADARDGSLKRMIKFAGDVKNSDSPLDGIREIKEDLFAFDLKKKSTTKKH